MGIKKYTQVCLICLLSLLVAACSNTRHLAAGETLFEGSKVNIVDKNNTSKKDRKNLNGDLAGVVRPKPNSKILGVPFKLTIYNAAGTPKKKKGLKNWLRNKVGEPPVLASAVHLDVNKALMVNLLQNKGFFNASVTGKLVTSKKKKTTAVFNVTTGPEYTIKEIHFLKDSSQISKDIDTAFSNTLLQPGAPYNLDLIKAERSRIDANLKTEGYYFFKSDYILVLVDSTIGHNQVNMYVKVKNKEVPDQAYNIYDIDSIFIYPNYKLKGAKADTNENNAVYYRGYNIVDQKKTFRPSVFYRTMRFETGEEYNINDQNTTLSRLVNMGTFKFVKNRFEPLGDTSLNVFYYLTQYPKHSLQFQIGALTQNDDRAGLQGSISLKNRNVFKGAEDLLFKINGSFEAQYTGVVKQPDIYDLGAETDLSFPYFVIPFIHVYTSGQYLPRSLIKLSYNYESESDLLRINSYKASYGYDWKTSPRTEHQFYPLNITYVKTDTLGNPADLNLLYGDLIFNGIIIGPTYEFTYNSQAGGQPKRNSFYFDGLVDLAGNILGAAEKADYKTHPQTVFGSIYAQYIKLQPDFRYYLRFSNTTTLATRVMAGIGIPYGNSAALPNIKAFWAGGNSDLRGFPSRLVGPGTYNGYYLNDTNNYIETLGDIKAEFNVEIRQNVYKFFNVAAFVDGGNIWLYRSSPQFPGGQFTADFYKQFDIDAGLGFRFDFKILLLRLDLGIPIREAWLPEDERWVFNKIDFGSGTWRKDNLVLNIGIGYPF